MSDAEKLNDIHHRPTVGRTLCWKCRDGRTRAHHRLCWRRGGGHGFERAAHRRRSALGEIDTLVHFLHTLGNQIADGDDDGNV